MAWFKKEKAQEKATRIKIPCKHKYRDFPWYIKGIYDVNYHEYEIYIKEPYVCVWCGERQDKVLQHIERRGTEEDCQNDIEIFEKEYEGYIMSRAIIEDMINDMQLVDRDYLRALAIVNPETLNGMDQNAQVALKKS